MRTRRRHPLRDEAPRPPLRTRPMTPLPCTRQLPPNAFGFFLTSRSQGLVMGPGGGRQGNLSLGGASGRYVAPGQIKYSHKRGGHLRPSAAVPGVLEPFLASQVIVQGRQERPLMQCSRAKRRVLVKLSVYSRTRRPLKKWQLPERPPRIAWLRCRNPRMERPCEGPDALPGDPWGPFEKPLLLQQPPSNTV